MNFVITMAGEGSRFLQAGYTLPKMLIEAKGKTLLQWSIDSLPLQLCSNLICVILKKHDEEFSLGNIIKKMYESEVRNITILSLSEVTRGQAETLFKAKSAVDLKKPLLVFNIDTMFYSSTLASKLQATDNDGVIGSFKASSPKFSYAKTGSDNFVIETAEKVVISDNALNGMYHFKNTELIFDIIEKAIENNELHKNEFYIAPLYNKMIESGEKFVLDRSEIINILGTPEELMEFENN